MNALDSTQYAWGISLGSMHWATHAVALDRQHPPIEKQSTDKHVPAAVLLNRTAGEPIKLDYWSPPHPRGTANLWPPEATVSRQTGGGRFPLAAAWTGRNTDQGKDYDNRTWPWQIDGDVHELSSVDAIANGASQLAKIHVTNAISAIVIPNDFRQREQQTLLDTCSASGVNASLLWLPVAAALAWLEENRAHLSPPTSRSDNPLRLPVVHADWGQVRCSTIELVPWRDSGGFRWIPARKRPVISDWFCPGFGWNEAAKCGTIDLQTMWNRLFASPSRELRTCSGDLGSNVLEQVAKWEVTQWSKKQVDETLSEYLDTIELPVSLLFIGDFATGVASGKNVSRLAHQQLLRQLPSSISDGVEGETLLARGAAIFARDRAEGRTSYLDTLPDLELFVDRNHQYDWLKLLGNEDQFVAGGQEWELPNPIDTLALRRGATSVKLVVAHEEHPGVRELQVLLDRPAEQQLSAVLHVSAVPAQGNAKLRLITESRDNIPRRSILANWDRMKKVLDDNGIPVSKETFMEMQPRAFPELFPRRWSHAKWRAALPSVENIVRLAREETHESIMKDVRSLKLLKDRLMAKDQSQSPFDATAIGSDGRAPIKQEILESLSQSLLSLWRYAIRSTNKSQTRSLNTIVRILGYISVDDPEFEAWLADSRSSHSNDLLARLHASGLVLRTPKIISSFIQSVFPNKDGRYSPNEKELKAVSQILRYRTNATQLIESLQSELIITQCLKIFEREMLSRSGSSLSFRWSSLIIVYILRRRMFDRDFLDPEKELAASAKELFRTAIERHKQRRLRPLGGSVDVPAALQQMIDYIDRKGAGDILMANE